MTNKIVRFIIIGFLVVLCIAGIVIFGLSKYYEDRFAVNTWINGIYCTGKTVNEVNAELIAQYTAPSFTIEDGMGNKTVIDGQAIGLRPDYSSALMGCMRLQAEHFWFSNINDRMEYEINPSIYNYDKSALQSKFDELPAVIEDQNRDKAVTILEKEDGFELIDGKLNRLNMDAAYTLLENSFTVGRTSINLQTSGCYEDLPYDEEDETIMDRYEVLIMYSDPKLVYDMGAEKINFDLPVMETLWMRNADGEIHIGPDGKPKVSKIAVKEWVDSLCDAYDTVGTVREFQTTSGRVVEVPYVKYGTQLDREAEYEYLWEALNTERDEVEEHIPTYIQEGFYRGLDDIGPYFVEVDMGEQKLYVHKDGEILLETDVVTGNHKRKWDTPEGINFVYSKQKNRTLRGANYATPVKFWMPVVGNIGLHDANWRKAFGGDIYLTDGSHGCVNIPKDVMPDVYELVELGTPVVMFY